MGFEYTEHLLGFRADLFGTPKFKRLPYEDSSNEKVVIVVAAAADHCVTSNDNNETNKLTKVT